MPRVNPYVAGNPVGGEEAFVGRSDVLAETLRMLRQPSASALVLYGQRRIGKTSVLLELAARLPESGPYLPVYFDLQDKAALPLSEVLGQLADVVRDRLPGSAGAGEGDALTPEEFRDGFLASILEQLDAGISLIFLFDEFDVLDSPSDSTAGADFFPFLRELLSFQPERMSFLFVIGRRTEDLSNLTLSLFKSMRTVHVSLLARDDVKELVRLAERNGSLSWSEAAVGAVYDLAGGHPYLTQQLCQEIWENAGPTDGPIEVKAIDVEGAVESTLRSATGALEWLWGGLGPAERVVAAVLAETGPEAIDEEEIHRHLQESGVRILIGELRDAPRVLREWDLIEPAEGGFRFRVELLRQWISSHKPIDRVREEMDRVQPVADSLFQASYGLYQADDFEQAVPLLRQVISLNPNHIRGQELLAEILLAQDQRSEARELLETLHEYQPAVARPRLVQVLLEEAHDADTPAEKTDLYERVLDLEPGQPEARSLFLRSALEQAEASDDMALRETLYRKVLALDPDEPQASEGITEMRRRRLVRVSRTIAELERAHRFQEALQVGEQIHQDYPDMEAELPDLEALTRKSQLEDLYQQAAGALGENDRGKARDLLVEIVGLQADYRDTTRLLHQAVHGSTGSLDRRPSRPWLYHQQPEIYPGSFEAKVSTGWSRQLKRSSIGLAFFVAGLLAWWAAAGFFGPTPPDPRPVDLPQPTSNPDANTVALYGTAIDRLRAGRNAATILKNAIQNASFERYATSLYLKLSLSQEQLAASKYAYLFRDDPYSTCALLQAVINQLDPQARNLHPFYGDVGFVDGMCGPGTRSALEEAISSNCCADPLRGSDRRFYREVKQDRESQCLTENYLLFGRDTAKYTCTSNSWPFELTRQWTLPEAARIFDLLTTLSDASRPHFERRNRLRDWYEIDFDLAKNHDLADDLVGTRISDEDAKILLNITHMYINNDTSIDPTAENDLQAADLEAVINFFDTPDVSS